MSTDTHILIIQIMQVALIFIVIPVLAFYAIRTIIKVKVHRAVYGFDLKRYVQDQILEKQAKLNREQEGQS